MHAGATPHPGLPFVPPRAADELLGAWLLRTAAFYGLSLESLLKRLAADVQPRGRRAHWFGINGAAANLESLAPALRVTVADLAAMAPPGCRPYWPQELGLCPNCLEKACNDARTTTWFRRWMHPLAVVCHAHGNWLSPVTAHALMRVRRAADFYQLAARNHSVQDPHAPEPVCVQDAAWLQQLCLARSKVRLPWGVIAPCHLIGLVDSVAGALMSLAATHARAIESCQDRWPGSTKTFTLEDRPGIRTQLTLPMRLHHRQWMMGAVGHILRHPAQARRWPPPQSPSVVNRMIIASSQGWPAHALEWICPQAAELERRRAELRSKLNVSPRYFQACAALESALASGCGPYFDPLACLATTDIQEQRRTNLNDSSIVQ